jgi:hypothetical protein
MGWDNMSTTVGANGVPFRGSTPAPSPPSSSNAGNEAPATNTTDIFAGSTSKDKKSQPNDKGITGLCAGYGAAVGTLLGVGQGLLHGLLSKAWSINLLAIPLGTVLGALSGLIVSAGIKKYNKQKEAD